MAYTSKYPKIVIDEESNPNTIYNIKRDITVEEGNDLLHHTHYSNDIINGSAENNENTSITSLQQSVNLLRSDVSNLRAALNGLQTAVDLLTTRIETLENKITNVTDNSNGSDPENGDDPVDDDF